MLLENGRILLYSWPLATFLFLIGISLVQIYRFLMENIIKFVHSSGH